MGWFDAQIRERIKSDDEQLSEAFAGMAGLVGSEKLLKGLQRERRYAELALRDILRYYHAKPIDTPEEMTEFSELLEYLLRPAGIMHRSVKLHPGWYKDAVGAMLAVGNDGSVVALLPDQIYGYTYRDYKNGTSGRVNKKTAKQLSEDAICFYSPFPLKKLGIPDMFRFMFGQIRGSDYALLFLAAGVAALAGLAVPTITHYLYNEVLYYNSRMLLMGAIATLLCVNISYVLFSTIRGILNGNISLKLSLSVESATMMRLLSMPPDFFKDYGSGELQQRISYVNNLCTMLFRSLFNTGLTAVFSLVYITQVFRYAPALVLPALFFTFLSAALSAAAALLRMRLSEAQMRESGKESGMVYALIGGLAKIKNAGAEKRAFARWSRQYVRAAKYIYQPPLFLKLSTALSVSVTLLGTIVMYYAAIRAQISLADYMAFNSAYAIVSGAFTALSGIVLTVSNIKPTMQMIKPLLETEPELDLDRRMVTRLRGGIELNNVSFRYSETMPNVLDGLDLKIRPGQYVAIVGRSGCGKSTLMRILLGFETPQKGAVYYDGRDLRSLDLRSLRQKIGVVMQSGRLFAGDIYSNITLSAPQLGLDGAWEAAEMAGMAEDIRRMPLGMHTLISEGQGGISGGQRQRLLIARAIAPKPRILLLDEATSALDNITQKQVSESLERLKCTRIVIAHRLSTIRHCDRIIVLDHGRIAEDGTYEELLAKGGLFKQLAERQLLEETG